MSNIHPTSIIHPDAIIGDSVTIGANTIINDQVVIGDHSVIDNNVTITGPCTIGTHNKIYSYACIGSDSQDLKYQGEETFLNIGNHNIIREFVTINRGTGHDQSVTIIGSHNTFLAYAHVAHDCIIGDHVIFSINAAIAGHVHVGDHAILSAYSAAHQFCRIGQHSMIGTYAWITQDIPAYLMVARGENMNAKPASINSVGLRRRDFSNEQILALKSAYRLLYRKHLKLADAIKSIEALKNEINGSVLENFLASINHSKRGIIR